MKIANRIMFVFLLTTAFLLQADTLPLSGLPWLSQFDYAEVPASLHAQSEQTYHLYLPGIVERKYELSGLDAVEASLQVANGEIVQLPEYVPEEVLLVLKPEVALERINEINSQHQMRTLRSFAFIRGFALKLPDDLPVIEAVEVLQRQCFPWLVGFG